MSYTITTHSSTGNVPDVTLEVETRAKAEETANGLAAAFLIDATGGSLGDWTDMTVYYGAPDRYITIKTVRTVAVAK